MGQMPVAMRRSLRKVWAQLEVAEELIATMGAGLSVTQTLMDRFGSRVARARAYQAAVLARRWQLESRAEERSQRLERYGARSSRSSSRFRAQGHGVRRPQRG